MFNKILVTLDGSPYSERVLPYAEAIAKKLGSTPLLAYAVDDRDMHAAGTSDLRVYVDQLVAHDREQALEYLNVQADKLRNVGLEVSAHAIVGNPPERIADYANEVGVDLIAMSTHGRAGLDRIRMGSVADRVLHITTKPLLLIHPTDGVQATAELKTIILPVDGSALAQQAVPVAEELAKAMGMTVKPARIISLASLGFVSPMPYDSGELTYQLLDAQEEDAKIYAAKLVQELGSKGITAEPVVVRGDPGLTLVEIAEKTPGALVVMTTHGRTGVGRFFLGSVADKVIRSSGAPVLVLPSRA